MNEDENIPYRSPVTLPPRDAATDNDDQDFSTLLEVQKVFHEAVNALYKDFNAFDLSKNVPKLEVQIAAKQIAFDILNPLKDTIDSAIQKVEQKRRGK